VRNRFALSRWSIGPKHTLPDIYLSLYRTMKDKTASAAIASPNDFRFNRLTGWVVERGVLCSLHHPRLARSSSVTPPAFQRGIDPKRGARSSARCSRASHFQSRNGVNEPVTDCFPLTFACRCSHQQRWLHAPRCRKSHRASYHTKEHFIDSRQQLRKKDSRPLLARTRRLFPAPQERRPTTRTRKIHSF